MATLPELVAARETLQSARLRGVREVRDSNGETIVFKSDSEMATALASVDREIAAMATGRPSRQIIFTTSKGF